MEKIQAAIKSARAQRQTDAPVRVSTPDRTGGSVDDLWSKLPPFDIPRKVVDKKRLVSYGGGKPAAPYDMLRTRILQQTSKHNWKRVAIVSPHANCGKTTTTANLALGFSRRSETRTMVLDLDLRHPGLANVLGLECRGGMADVLGGSVDFVDHGFRYENNVAFGFNSEPSPLASEILQSQKAHDLLDQLQADFDPDIMLFDMPPLMTTDENFGFLSNVDCAVLIVEAERTTVEQVDMAERHLAELTNVLGVVLNKSQYTSSSYLYGYGYS